jgi:hypothetical protein
MAEIVGGKTAGCNGELLAVGCPSSLASCSELTKDHWLSGGVVKKTRIVRTAEVTVETEETTVIRDRRTGINRQNLPATEIRGSHPSKTGRDSTDRRARLSGGQEDA